MMSRSEIGHLFLTKNGWGKAKRTFLQGDASSRKYERLNLNGKKALFVDSPEKPDGPKSENGKTYSEIAHIALTILPFVAIDQYLGSHGFTVPEIYAADLENGFLLLEDLGPDVYGEKILRGDDMDEPYKEAINVLVQLASLQPVTQISVEGEETYLLPTFDQDAFLIEAELLTNWFWKWLGLTLPESAEKSFKDLWQDAFARLPAQEYVLTLRDYHSPNIIWCGERNGLKRAGLIDFQDAVIAPSAYDLVSLLQDARTDIPSEVEELYKSLYIKKRLENNPRFDKQEFDLAYAILGAQRNTKILGIFARLALRDNKPHYLAHIPRVMSYLERCLEAPGLESIKAWYDTYLPAELREDISHQLLKADIGRNAIILSAGLGTRMAPLSDTCPKPLINVNGKPLLKYGLDRLADINAEKVVVNVHYLADQIEEYLDKLSQEKSNFPHIIISDERNKLLETGGGIQKALSYLGDEAFFVLNSDSFWLEKETQNLRSLIEFWDDHEMDCLILLANKNRSLGYTGKGDFELLEDGRLKRRADRETDYVVSGTYLVHPRLFENAMEGPFSMNILWDKALKAGRLFGLELDGTWLHIGTPEAVEEAEKYISDKNLGLS